MAGHGWVIPNSNGLVVRCGGPALCEVCQAEQSVLDCEVSQAGQKLLERTALQKRNDLMRPVDLPPIGSIWKHYKGGHYKVILIANDQTTFPERFPVSVVYQSAETLYIWTRPLSQWLQSMTLVEFGDEIRGKGIERIFVDETSEEFKELKKEAEKPMMMRDLKSSSYYLPKKT